MRSAAVVLGAALACTGLVAGNVRACNLCVEDKIAATYDWDVISSAAQAGRQVVFTALAGPVRPEDRELERWLRRQVEGVSGVVAASVRVSLAPPAISFACDVTRHPPKSLVASMNRRLAVRCYALSILRVGAPGSPPRAAR